MAVDVGVIDLSPLTVGGNAPMYFSPKSAHGIVFGASSTTYYRMRAYDAVAGYVTWTATDPTTVPAAGATTPNHTGALSARHIQSTYEA